MDARALQALFTDNRKPAQPEAAERRLWRVSLSVRQQCRLFGRTGSLLQAGLSLTDALELQQRDCRQAAEARLLGHCLQSVGAGRPLADALRQCPRAIAAHHAEAVHAGELSGQLVPILIRLGDQLDRQFRMQQHVRKTLRYPLGVLVFALGVTAAMLWFVVPVFEQLFARQHASLPAPTQALLFLSEQSRQKGPALLAGLSVVVPIMHWQRRHGRRGGAGFWGLLITLVPGLRPIVLRAALARTMRLLSLMLSAGIPIADALGVASDAAENPRQAEGLAAARQRLIAGQTLHQALSEQRGWPPFVAPLLRTGEATGQLDTMLDRAADLLEHSVEQRSGRLLALLEPTIMAILAVLVGGLLLALYLPVFSMGAAF